MLVVVHEEGNLVFCGHLAEPAGATGGWGEREHWRFEAPSALVPAGLPGAGDRRGEARTWSRRRALFGASTWGTSGSTCHSGCGTGPRGCVSPGDGKATWSVPLFAVLHPAHSGQRGESSHQPADPRTPACFEVLLAGGQLRRGRGVGARVSPKAFQRAPLETITNRMGLRGPTCRATAAWYSSCVICRRSRWNSESFAVGSGGAVSLVIDALATCNL